jgi:hypothetical protein
MMLVGCSAPSIGAYPEGDAVNLPQDKENPDEKADAGGGPRIATRSKQTLTVTISGAGKGAVTSAPAGVTCNGTTCTGTFDKGTAVALTATAASGSIFKGWTGSCSGPGSCSPFLNSDLTVTAEFVTLDGAWTGTYTHKQPAGNCNFSNAGTLTMNLTTGATPTSSMTGTGFEVRNTGTCEIVQPNPRDGSSAAASVSVSGDTITGTWTVAIPNTSGPLPLPFTAKVAGNKITGSWTCANCSGSFSMTKQ